jgi:beta-aspartyl-dipeptidase (metallo-type)
MNTETSVIKLIKRAKVYSPDYLGVKDLLFVNDRIIKIDDDIQIDEDKFNVDIING